MVEINGNCEEDFLLVQDAFEANFDSGEELGASAAVVHQARAHAEAAFATNALCFFVGWSWVVVPTLTLTLAQP